MTTAARQASGGAAATTGGTKVKAGKPGGTLTFLAAGDVDYIDPGQTTTRSATWSSTPSTARCTRSSPTTRSSRSRTSPTGEPEISADNKTITVHIKKGIKYAPPVNREVKTADIKYAFERAFSKNVPQRLRGRLLQLASSARRRSANTGDIKPISGIETPDDNTLVLKLKTPSAAAGRRRRS